MSDTKTSLSLAVKFLGATEVMPGWYAWRGCEFECYVVASSETLASTDKWEYWAAGIDDDDPVVSMPEWWSPERPFAIRLASGEYEVPYTTMTGLETLIRESYPAPASRKAITTDRKRRNMQYMISLCLKCY